VYRELGDWSDSLKKSGPGEQLEGPEEEANTPDSRGRGHYFDPESGGTRKRTEWIIVGDWGWGF